MRTSEVKHKAAQKAQSWRCVEVVGGNREDSDRPLDAEELKECEAVAKMYDVAAKSGKIDDYLAANTAAETLRKK